jgi:hypothetical protein
MAQAVTHRYLTAEARVLARVSPCGNCGGQSGIATGFCPSSSVSPVSIIPPWLSIPIYHLRDEQQARWCPQSRDIVSPHQYEQHNVNIKSRC